MEDLKVAERSRPCQFTDTFSTEIGYRYFDTDYRDGGFEYDMAEHGLFLGFNFTFWDCSS